MLNEYINEMPKRGKYKRPARIAPPNIEDDDENDDKEKLNEKLEEIF